MAIRGEQKHRTRRNLIDAALKLSAERGFASLSLREVAKEAGITPAAFYRHFHDMEELGLAMVDEVGLGLRQLLREGRRRFTVEGGAIRASMEVFVQYITENANLWRLHQGERQGSSSAFRKALYAEIDRFIEDVTEDIERTAKLRGQPLQDAPLAAEAIVAVAFTIGGEALDMPKHRRGDLIERLIKECKMILRGAIAESPGPARAKTKARKV